MVEEEKHPVPALAVRTETSPPDVERLFDEHHARVFQAAYRVTGSAQDAEDVLQTVFMRLMRRDEALEPSPAAYLHRAAVNAALDVIRGRKNRPTVDFEAVAAETVPSASPSPERESIDRQLRTRLRAALGLLPERAATIFALRYFEDLSNDEIAEALETTPNVVAVTLFRARTRLREELA